MYEVFVGIISWYDGPLYEMEYVLVCVDNDELEIITRELLKEYNILK